MKMKPRNQKSLSSLVFLITTSLACSSLSTLITPPTDVPIGESGNVGRGISLTILDVILPADDMISEPIKYSETPQPNSEFAIIKLRIQCNEPADMGCGFSSFFIDIADQDGSVQIMKSQDEYVHSSQLVKASIPDELEWSMTGLSGGSTLEGNVVLLVSKDINYTTIVYQELYGVATYFAMP